MKKSNGDFSRIRSFVRSTTRYPVSSLPFLPDPQQKNRNRARRQQQKPQITGQHAVVSGSGGTGLRCIRSIRCPVLFLFLRLIRCICPGIGDGKSRLCVSFNCCRISVYRIFCNCVDDLFSTVIPVQTELPARLCLQEADTAALCDRHSIDQTAASHFY